MGKATICTDKGTTVITNRLIEKEAVNKRIMDEIASDILPNLLPITIETKRKETTLYCRVNGMLSLQSYFNTSLSKNEFLRVVKSVIRVIRQCENYRINASNLELNPNGIFLSAASKETYCVYWPIVNNTAESCIGEFFKELPQTVSFTNTTASIFRIEYNSFFNGNGPFSLNAFERFVDKLMNNFDETSKPDNTETVNRKKPVHNQQIEYDPIKALKEAGHKHQQSSKTREDVIPAAKEHKGTVILDEDCIADENKPEVIKAFLVRTKTNDRIGLDKSVTIIGSDAGFCDYAVADNRTISRKHVKIEKIGDAYYITDLNSTNKTKVGGTAITPNNPVMLTQGVTVVLSNESFCFECTRLQSD